MQPCAALELGPRPWPFAAVLLLKPVRDQEPRVYGRGRETPVGLSESLRPICARNPLRSHIVLQSHGPLAEDLRLSALALRSSKEAVRPCSG